VLNPRTTTLTAVASALAALVLIGAPGALADGSYGDPAGDSGLAPDITQVAISHDAAGMLSFAITTSQPNLTPENTFWGFVDSDQNAATGLPHLGIGADHMFLADGDGGLMSHITGNSLTFDFNADLRASYANGIETVQFPRTVIGSSDRFAIVFEADLDDANGDTIATDRAPDGPPAYVYSFVAEALTLSMGKPVGTPVKPVAGKAFVVSAPVARSDDQAFASGEVSCQARVGGQTLRASGRVASGFARCSMRIPKNAKRKVLRGSITVVADDVTVKKPFSFTVR
jgi:hypothetical protein